MLSQTEESSLINVSSSRPKTDEPFPCGLTTSNEMKKKDYKPHLQWPPQSVHKKVINHTLALYQHGPPPKSGTTDKWPPPPVQNPWDKTFVPKEFPTTHKIPSTMPKRWDLHASSPLMLRPPQSTAVPEVQISKSSSWLEAFAARAAHTSTMSATSMVGIYNFQQKVLRFIRDSASKNNIHNDISLVDDLIQRANSMALEAHIMTHDSGVTATELFTHLHMLRRHSVLDSPTVALPQRDKDRLLVMSVGGNDLFGPDARKVHEWKLDTEEENVKLIARVFDERAQLWESTATTVQQLHTSTNKGEHVLSPFFLQNSGTVRAPGSICDNSHTYTPPRSQEHHGQCSVPSQSTQSNRMASSNRNLEQSVLCLRNSPDRHVCHSGEQGDARLCFSLPGRQSMGGRRPVAIMGRLGTSLCISSGSHCSQDSPENPKISGHHSHHDRITTSIPTVASTSSPVEHTSSDLSPRRPTVPVCAQPLTPSIPPRSQTIGSSRVELIRDVLKRHHFPDTVVDMAADPLRDSSSNVYNSHWKAFALWANKKGILPSDLSFITLAEYLVYLFSQNKKVNTILVHKASISSVLKLLNPPTAIQESTLHNVIRRMTILRPREQEILPRWHLSVALKGLMKPPFAINGTDRHISLELLSYQTAFLVALASGARGSELVALSRASHNLEFTTLASGVKQVSIRMVPKFIPKNQRPEIIFLTYQVPGIAHLFPHEPERLLCPVRALGFYIVKLADSAQNDPLEKLFVHFNPATQLFTTHFRRWVAETIRLTYENSSESDLPKIKAHDVRESPHPSLSTGILLWKISADWSDGSHRTYSSVTISESWRQIRSYRTSLWWPHGRLSRNRGSYLLITRHLHQCRLTLVVYQWQVGTFE